MKRVEQTWVIEAPVSRVWQAFVDPRVIEKWGAGPTKMNAVKDGKFTMWGGDIYGTNTKIVKEKLLVQDWFSGSWEQPSIVVFKFSSQGDKTKIELLQTNIPDHDARDIDQGWKDYYLGPIKEFLEK